MISHKPQAILLILLGLIIISSISMGCEMCDLRELFVKYSKNQTLEVTIVLTEPNNFDGNSHSSVYNGPGLLTFKRGTQVP